MHKRSAILLLGLSAGLAAPVMATGAGVPTSILPDVLIIPAAAPGNDCVGKTGQLLMTARNSDVCASNDRNYSFDRKGDGSSRTGSNNSVIIQQTSSTSSTSSSGSSTSGGSTSGNASSGGNNASSGGNNASSGGNNASSGGNNASSGGPGCKAGGKCGDTRN